MSDTERLLDELWPCPEPPDLTLRVMAAMRGEVPRPRRRRWIAAASAATAALGLAAFLIARHRHGAEVEGEVVAQSRQTVDIGGRAAAALEPGAALTWSVRGPRVRVAQPRGSVFYRVEHGGPFRVTTPAGAIEVTGTCFRVNAETATVVTVLEGAVRVQGDRGELALAAGQTARLVAGHAPELVEPPSVDELRERASRAEARLQELEELLAAQPKIRRAALVLPWSPSPIDVYGEGAEKVSLGVPEGAGKVEVSGEATFARRIYFGSAEGDVVTVPAPHQGELFWRVVGGATVAHARFLREPRPPSAPRNMVSDERESTTVFFQGPPPELTLTFADADGASHPVRVFRAGALDRPVFTRDVSVASCTIPAGTLPEGRYVWTAGNGYRKLQIVYENTQSGVLIHRARRAARGIEVEGTAPPGARLSVNGRFAPLDERGRFSLRVSSAPSRLLVFRLRAPTGQTSFWLRRL